MLDKERKELILNKLSVSLEAYQRDIHNTSAGWDILRSVRNYNVLTLNDTLDINSKEYKDAMEALKECIYKDSAAYTVLRYAKKGYYQIDFVKWEIEKWSQ
jgi:hypothetical protein